ncbi:MAG: ROK family protein [Acidobacteria bacterium]|nr:ROK family protein [Acidobacteriota bacterium]
MTEKTAADEPAHSKTIGVVLSDHICAGLIVDHALQGSLLRSPRDTDPQDLEDGNSMVEMPTEAVVAAICDLVVDVAKGHESSITAVGIAIPGLVRQGVVEEAPNLPQLKGARIKDLVARGLTAHNIHAPLVVVNDADAMAAGLASIHGKLDSFIRVWTLGTGIGYGVYPSEDGVWEGGHCVVSVDEKENYCGCGGRGHLEGIMGHRAMRLRFLDMEPEEVFEAANRRHNPDPRCLEFKHLFHRALAAGTASSIHFRGAGKFFLTGYNMRFLDINMLKDYLHQMVKMSSLQSYMLEVVDDDEVTRAIGAAVAAEHVTRRDSYR